MCSACFVRKYYMHGYPARHRAPNPFEAGGTADDETREKMRQALALLDSIDKSLGDVACDDINAGYFFAGLESAG